ncbi:sensor histidine kinase [Brevibacterium renqingii]|uniref:sensor histidine kinase n=1 Tax=Brevibacterium renqingii TaxID=2776916 RepID=UPI001ADF2B0F|nr:sensor histidine kinase [Brevibacterium renqingii]
MNLSPAIPPVSVSTGASGTRTPYSEKVPSPAEPSQSGRSWWARLRRNLGRDSVLVAPGLLISVIAMPTLLTLFAISIATAIIWVGVLLLPLTLTIARAFGTLSRGRARAWGVPIAEAAMRPRGRGLRRLLAPTADARAWLDLLFEAVFALPIRIVTFSVSAAWFFGGLGGLSFFLWGRFLPEGGGDTVDWVAAWLTNSPVTDLGFTAEATFQFAAGLILLLTFPFVLHAMALLEIAAIRAALPPVASAAPVPPIATAAPLGHSAETSSTRTSAFAQFAGGQGWFWLASAFVGVVLVAVSWPVTAVLYGVPSIIAMLVAVAQGVALVLAVRWSTAAIGLGLAAQAASILLTADTSGLVRPVTVTSLLALVFLHLLVGLRHRWIHVVVLWSLSALVGVLGLVLPHAGGFAGALSNVITTAAIAAGAGIIGVVGSLFITGRRQLAVERELSAAELAKRQELEERNRIAQELHDVVAHSMSVISVQATTAKYRLPGLDERSLGEFDSMASSARKALTEMRGLLAILRGGHDADLAPQPTVDDVPALGDVTRGSGAAVDLDFPADPVELSPTASLTAFRVVQESLSNALRHAAGAPVTVALAFVGEFVEINVTNGPAEAAAASRTTPQNRLGGGFGLRGMRERVEALGGSLRVGPTTIGGFEVRATLPAD